MPLLASSCNCPWGASSPEDYDCEGQWETAEPVDVLCSIDWQIATMMDSSCDADWNISQQFDLDCESDFERNTPQDFNCESDWDIAPPLDVLCATLWNKMTPMDSDCGSDWYIMIPKDSDCDSDWRLSAAKDIDCLAPWDVSIPLDVICSLEYEYNSVLNKKVVVFHCEYPWEAERSFIVIDQDVIIRRVSDNQEIQVLPGLSIQKDIDSAFWTISGATATRVDANYIRPTTSGPIEIEAVINNYTWRFLVETINENYEYNSGGSYSFTGTSPSIVLTKPYSSPQTKTYTVATQAQQITQFELNGTGWSWDWNVMDWAIPTNVFSVSEQTTLEIIATIARAVGGVVHTKGGFPNGTPYEQTLEINYRYPTSPKTWDVGTPDESILDGILSESLTWVPKPKYDHVFVTGEGAGYAVDVRRDGENWDNCGPTIVDGLTLEVNVARERGRNFLDENGYDQTHHTVALPLPDSTDGNPVLCLPGYMMEIQDTFETWRGQVVSLKVDVQAPGVTQTLTLERHYTESLPTYLSVILNPYDKATSLTLTGSNLVASKTSGGSGFVLVRANVPIDSGLRYFEVGAIGANFPQRIGICNDFVDFSASYVGQGPDADGTRGICLVSNGSLWINGVETASWSSAFVTGDIVGVAVNASNGKIWFSVNGVWQASGDPANDLNPAGTIAGDLYPAVSFYSQDVTKFGIMYFKTSSWTYSAPTGFFEIPEFLEPTTYQRASCSDRDVNMLPDAQGYQIKRITAASAWKGIRCINGKNGGKRYFELIFQGGSNRIYAGVGKIAATLTNYFSVGTNGWSFGIATADKYKVYNATSALLSAGLPSYGDIFGYAVDIDNGYIWFSYNGTWLEGNPNTGVGASYTGVTGPLYPMVSIYNLNDLVQFVFLESDWTYTAPTGFIEW